MADSTDDLEPLFDYRRVQPPNFVCLDDDGSDVLPVPKRWKISTPVVKEVDDELEVVEIVNGKDKDEEDWLSPPPKFSTDLKNWPSEDSTIKELRLKKQELKALAKSADAVLRNVEESVKKELYNSVQASLEAVAGQPTRPSCERAKIVISIQDKDGVKQFRIYKDEKLERLFKMYTDKVKLGIQSLVFLFDGDKINPTATPEGLGMEDDDIIEVHVKKS